MDSADTATDRELVGRIRRGDHEAFAALAERHRPWLQRLLYRLTWDEEGELRVEGGQWILFNKKYFLVIFIVLINKNV